jgi:glutamate dehydrogenase/leucine dehydrogenase
LPVALEVDADVLTPAAAEVLVAAAGVVRLREDIVVIT